MDNLQNLDIFDFLTSLGKHTITKATQGFSNSRPKQSKCSHIVFVEDTDEYANLSNECGFTGRENKGTCFGGEWKTKDNSYGSRTKKNNTYHKWKGNTQPKDNCGWGEKDEVTQNSGWETGTWNESDSGWGEQDGGGWDKGTQAKCDDGWGEEKKDTSWGCGDREAASDTGWGKEEECCEGTKGTEKAGTHIGQQSSVQEEDKGWRCSLQGEDKSWGSSLLKEDDGDGWGEGKEPTFRVGAKTKGVSACGGWGSTQQEGIQKGWRNSTRQENNGGWGEDKSAPDKRGRGAQGEGTQSGWGSSIEEVSDGGLGEAKSAAGGWGEDKSAAGGRERGAQEEATEKGWGSSIHQEIDGGWGQDTSAAGGRRKKEEVRWEKGAREEDRQNRRGGSVLQETSGGWKRGSQNEWESSTLEKNGGGGWGEDKCAPVGWERATLEEGTQDGWGSSVHGKNEEKGVSGGWGEQAQTNYTQMQTQGSMPRKSNAGWAREGKVSTDGWQEKGKAASRRWGEGTQKEGDGWGAERKLATGQWGGKKKFDPARWRTDTTKERASSGWRGNAQAAGSAGWGEGTVGGWGQSMQQEVDDGWGSSIQKSVGSRWGEGKDSTCSGWGARKGVADGRDKDAQKENDGWGEKRVATGGGWKAGAQKEGGDGWGSSIEKKSDSGWGEENRTYAGGSRAFEETNEWGKAKEGVSVGWEQTTHDAVDDGWGQSIQTEVDSGWGQAKDGSAGGLKEERGGTTCGWGEDKGAWGKGTSDTSLGQENKATTGRLEKGTQKEHGWESSTQEDSNAGWGEATAEGTLGGWEQSSHQGGDDGWGEFTREDNTTSDTSGRNRTSKSAAASWNKAVNGWEPSTQGDDTRRSGTFGPSGSNTVPLGKRKGSETNIWTRPMPDNGVTGQLNGQEPHQDGRQRWGKRFNNGNAWRDSASNCPQNHNRRPRLRALISLPEYSEMDELYKATNRILHHSGYQQGDRLNPEDERFVLEEVLAHHQEKESKLGCGVDYVMIDSHADHQVSCFWVVRTDGSKIDFSYWKCLEHLFEVKYPHAVREVRGEGGNDGGVVVPVESVEAKEKDSREDGVAPLGRVEAEEQVTTQEENDGW